MSKFFKISPVFLFAIFFLLANKISLAAVRCETQYGGGETCVRTGELQIDKEVWDPDGSQFVDNLSLSSHKFAPGDEVIFHLKIKNVGDATFDTVHVIDTLPSHLELSSGSLDFDINDLSAGETEEREIKVRVVPADRFPNDKTVICVVNTAESWSGDEKDKDTAQVCLERKVLGLKVLPPTGPEEWLGLLLFSTAAGAVGIYFVKFSKQ
jgi:uncharacterized repeat protein (TIGR01451 family)